MGTLCVFLASKYIGFPGIGLGWSNCPRHGNRYEGNGMESQCMCHIATLDIALLFIGSVHLRSI